MEVGDSSEKLDHTMVALRETGELQHTHALSPRDRPCRGRV